jgi:peroxiredoxin
VAVTSSMLPLGTPAPTFRLPSIQGQVKSNADFAEADALLVMFISNHCPFVRHIEAKLGEVVGRYQGEGLAVVGICSNDVEQTPEDTEEGLEEQATRAGFDFPYLVDDGQLVAKAFGAACTPDLFLFGSDRTLVYRGRFDAATPGNDEPVTGQELEHAIVAALRGEPLEAEQLPSMGCGIKWKPGNAPE